MKKSYSASLLIIFAGTFSAVAVQAEESASRGPIPFVAYDKDDNNFISEEEFNIVREERMSIRAAEGRPMRGTASAPKFSDFDANSDSKLTQDELTAGQNAQMGKRSGMAMEKYSKRNSMKRGATE